MRKPFGPQRYGVFFVLRGISVNKAPGKRVLGIQMVVGFENEVALVVDVIEVEVN